MLIQRQSLLINFTIGFPPDLSWEKNLNEQKRRLDKIKKFKFQIKLILSLLNK